MAVNSTIKKTTFTSAEAGKIFRKVHIDELRVALNNLDALKGNVNNCNYAASNCCQSTTNQSCQNNQGCQGCQGNQACQSLGCQKSANQSCQGNQGCQNECKQCAS